MSGEILLGAFMDKKREVDVSYGENNFDDGG